MVTLPTYYDLVILSLEGFYGQFREDFESMSRFYNIRHEDMEWCYSSVVEYAVDDALGEVVPGARLAWQYRRNDLFESIYRDHYPLLKHKALRLFPPYLNRVVRRDHILKLMVTGKTAIMAIGRYEYP